MNATSGDILRIENLCVQYEASEDIVYAVNGVTLALKRGETLGLVGETGAGKTSTAKSIMGILPEKTSKITAGSIVFEDQELCGLSKKELLKIRGQKISMIFQDPLTALRSWRTSRGRWPTSSRMRASPAPPPRSVLTSCG